VPILCLFVVRLGANTGHRSGMIILLLSKFKSVFIYHSHSKTTAGVYLV